MSELRDVEPGQLWSCGEWFAITVQRSGGEESDMWRALVLLSPNAGLNPRVGTIGIFPIAHRGSSWYRL